MNAELLVLVEKFGFKKVCYDLADIAFEKEDKGELKEGEYSYFGESLILLAFDVFK